MKKSRRVFSFLILYAYPNGTKQRGRICAISYSSKKQGDTPALTNMILLKGSFI